MDIEHYVNGLNLSHHTIEALQDEGSHCYSHSKCNSKIISLCSEIKKHQKSKSESKINHFYFSGFTDYPKDGNVAQQKPMFHKSGIKTDVPNAKLDQNQLISIIKNNESSVRDIIDIVTVNDANLETILMNTWEKLKKTEDKHKFIELLSAHPLCSVIICKRILLLEQPDSHDAKLRYRAKKFIEKNVDFDRILLQLKIEESFYSTLGIIKTNIGLFQSDIVSDLFIPLLVDDDSFLAGEPDQLKEILPLLSHSQRSDFIRCFVELMEKSACKNHLQILHILVEDMRLNNMILEKLVQVFSRDSANFIDDRYFGKILVIILESCSSETSSTVIKELSQVCRGYKGVMRFRINASLKKLIH